MVFKQSDWWEKLPLIGNKRKVYYRDVNVITKVLVTGAQGQLGKDLVDLLKVSGYSVFGMGKPELDIINEEKVNNIVSYNKTRDYCPLCCFYTS